MTNETETQGGFLDRKRKEIRGRAPRTARALIFVLTGFVCAAIVWAGRTELQEIARAPGEIAPTDHLTRIEHFDGGIVREVHVRQGDRVETGDLLARLTSPSLTEAELQAKNEIALMTARRDMLLSLLEDAAAADAALEPYARVRRDLHRSRRAALEAREKGLVEALKISRSARVVAADRVRLAEEELDRLQSLADMGYLAVTAVRAQQDRLEAVRGDLISNESALARAVTEHADARAALAEADLAYGQEIEEQLYDVTQEIARLELKLADLSDRRDRLEVVAPEPGIVQLSATARGGEVVEPGELMFELLPTTANLVAEVRLSPTDIGHVRIGDAATIKSTTFDARRYGELHGRVSVLSPTSLLDEQEKPYFAATVELDSTRLTGGAVPAEVTAGMVVTAEIATAQRTVLDYLAAPIRRSIDAAMSER